MQLRDSIASWPLTGRLLSGQMLLAIPQLSGMVLQRMPPGSELPNPWPLIQAVFFLHPFYLPANDAPASRAYTFHRRVLSAREAGSSRWNRRCLELPIQTPIWLSPGPQLQWMQYCPGKALDPLILLPMNQRSRSMYGSPDQQGTAAVKLPSPPRLLCVVALLPVPLDRCLTIEQPP